MVGPSGTVHRKSFLRFWRVPVWVSVGKACATSDSLSCNATTCAVGFSCRLPSHPQWPSFAAPDKAYRCRHPSRMRTPEHSDTLAMIISELLPWISINRTKWTNPMWPRVWSEDRWLTWLDPEKTNLVHKPGAPSLQSEKLAGQQCRHGLPWMKEKGRTSGYADLFIDLQRSVKLGLGRT